MLQDDCTGDILRILFWQGRWLGWVPAVDKFARMISVQSVDECNECDVRAARQCYAIARAARQRHVIA